MLRLPDGKVWLNEGEIIPVICECGALYQPQRGLAWSQCPVCCRTNDHKPNIVAVPFEKKD